MKKTELNKKRGQIRWLVYVRFDTLRGGILMEKGPRRGKEPREIIVKVEIWEVGLTRYLNERMR